MQNQTNPFINSPAPSPRGSAAASADVFEVDLSDVEEMGLIPSGPYRAKCVNVEQSVSKGGNPMFVWDFEILDGVGRGRILKVFTAITPAAMWKVAETVIALGVGQSGELVKFKRSDVVGKECGVVIEDSEYNGNVRSQIQRVVSLDELRQIGSK